MTVTKTTETDGRSIFYVEVEDAVIDELKLKGIDVLEEIKKAVRDEMATNLKEEDDSKST